MTDFTWLEVHVSTHKTHNLLTLSRLKSLLNSFQLELGALLASFQVRKRGWGSIYLIGKEAQKFRFCLILKPEKPRSKGRHGNQNVSRGASNSMVPSLHLTPLLSPKLATVTTTGAGMLIVTSNTGSGWVRAITNLSGTPCHNFFAFINHSQP